MQEKKSLREFQDRLAEKLAVAQAGTGATSKLGFVAGGRHWLVSLDQINEVVTLPGLTGVPWTQPWFVGVASVRGALYGCTDLAAYLGLAEPMPPGEARLLLAHPRFGINAALRVERALGLRAVTELEAEPAEGDSLACVVARWRSPDQQIWSELSMECLVATPGFMEVAL
jgi:twitching motility protein PilI